MPAPSAFWHAPTPPRELPLGAGHALRPILIGEHRRAGGVTEPPITADDGPFGGLVRSPDAVRTTDVTKLPNAQLLALSFRQPKMRSTAPRVSR